MDSETFENYMKRSTESGLKPADKDKPLPESKLNAPKKKTSIKKTSKKKTSMKKKTSIKKTSKKKGAVQRGGGNSEVTMKKQLENLTAKQLHMESELTKLKGESLKKLKGSYSKVGRNQQRLIENDKCRSKRLKALEEQITFLQETLQECMEEDSDSEDESESESGSESSVEVVG